MFRQFKFEEPTYPKLEKIPISTRFKLDALDLQFSMECWNKLPLEERWVLCHLPIRSRGERESYILYVSYLLRRLGFTASARDNSTPKKNAWDELSRVPSEVAQKMAELNLPLYWPEWIKLDDMARYAIYKLCQEEADPALIQQLVQELLGLPPSPTAR
jgi:hypothetical protein